MVLFICFCATQRGPDTAKRCILTAMVGESRMGASPGPYRIRRREKGNYDED